MASYSVIAVLKYTDNTSRDAALAALTPLMNAYSAELSPNVPEFSTEENTVGLLMSLFSDVTADVLADILTVTDVDPNFVGAESGVWKFVPPDAQVVFHTWS